MRTLIVGVMGLVSSSAIAQVAIRNPFEEIYNKCIAEAVTANEIRSANDQTHYSCFGQTAKNWFDVATDEKVVRDKNGIFIARYYGDSGYCAHQIEDAEGKPASTYICEIVVPKAK